MHPRHNSARSRFELGSGVEPAVCEYRRDGSVWILHHTFVPETMRGAVVPACSYVAAYIQRHPAYAPLVRADA